MHYSRAHWWNPNERPSVKPHPPAAAKFLQRLNHERANTAPHSIGCVGSHHVLRRSCADSGSTTNRARGRSGRRHLHGPLPHARLRLRPSRLVPRANLNIGIGHTFGFLKRDPIGDELTFAYTYENAGSHGFFHTDFGSHTEALGVMKNFGLPKTKAVTGYTWVQAGLSSFTGYAHVENRFYDGEALGAPSTSTNTTDLDSGELQQDSDRSVVHHNRNRVHMELVKQGAEASLQPSAGLRQLSIL